MMQQFRGKAEDQAMSASPRQAAALPVAWTTYRTVKTIREDFRDLRAHGIGLAGVRAESVQQARDYLHAAEETGMKLHIDIPEVTERANLVEQIGCDVRPALMIGGVYEGKAIDRHLFSFSPAEQEILIEPPVYNQQYGRADRPLLSRHARPRPSRNHRTAEAI